jgi:succinate dehydrogenase / fumarate reductase cytochrome b subunit
MAEVDLHSSLEARRPLSPHLSAYRFTLSMMMSVGHRVTGVPLYFGTLLLVWYLVAAATDKKSFDLVAWVMGSFLGQLVLLGYTWALLQHLINGIRHLIYDAGYGWEDPTRERLVYATLIVPIVLTIIVFGLAHLIH